MIMVVPPAAAASVTGRPVVGGHGAAEGHIHVCVRIDKTGHYEPVARVDGLGAAGVQVCSDGDDLLVLDEHIGPVAAFGGHDGAAGKE